MIHQLSITKMIKKYYKKRFVKEIKVSQKKKKIKIEDMITNDTKINQKMKNKSWLSIKKYYKIIKNALF